MLRHVATIAVLLLAAPAIAQERVSLDFTSAPTCLDEATLRHLVAAERGGVDPFTADAAKRVSIKLHRLGPTRFTADVSITDDDGQGHYEPAHQPVAQDCTALVDEVALVVASWLPVEPAPPVPPAPAPPPLPPPTPVIPPKPTPLPAVPPPPRRIRIRVGASVRADLETSLRPAAGLVLDGGIRVGQFSADAELHWIPSAGAALPTVYISTSLLLGALDGCMHFGQAVEGLLCLLVEAGETQYTPATGSSAVWRGASPYFGGGARAGIEIPLPSPFFLRAAADLAGVGSYGVKVHTVGPGSPVAIGGLTANLAGGAGAGLGASF